MSEATIPTASDRAAAAGTPPPFAADTARPVVLRRHPGDLVRVVLGAFVLFWTGWVAHDRDVPRWEQDLFRLVNRLPEAVETPFVTLMQAGAVAAVPVTAAVAVVLRRFRLARDLAVSGLAAWALAVVVKEMVDRGRPGTLLDAVLLRGGEGAGGLGFPSGHVAVAAALAGAAGPYLSRWWRRVAWALVAAVALARMFVGVHLPLDVVGGFALGYLCAAAVHLAFRAPDGDAPSPAEIGAALQGAGVTLDRLEPAHVDARGSVPWYGRSTGGRDVFVKAVGDTERDADALFKAFRFVALRDVEDEAPYTTPKRALEHEAYVSMLAERAGVRTPSVLAVVGTPAGGALLAEARVGGRSLDRLAGSDVDDALLDELWAQVRLLHAARVAHRDLRAANVLVDEDGHPWLIDFGFGEGSASDRRLAQDVAELLTSTATVVGADRAVAAAARRLPGPALAASLPLLQPLALSSQSRRDARATKGLLADLRSRVAAATGVEEPPLAEMTRVRPRTLLMLAAIGLAVYVVLPQLGEFEQTVDAAKDADYVLLLGALVLSATSYLAAALMLQGSSPVPLPLLANVQTGLAASFANRVTPGSVGGFGVNIRYLQRNGLELPVATAAIALNSTASFVAHMSLLVTSAVAVGSLGIGDVKLPTGWHLLVAVAVGLALAGVVVFLPVVRRRVGPVAADAWSGIREVLRSPGRATRLVLGAYGNLLSYFGAFAISCLAFGLDIGLQKELVVFLGGSIVGGAAPTPGGLGGIEAALIAGLTGLGADPGPAVAGVLTYRLVTFWLPTLPGWLAFRHLRRHELL